MIRQLTRFGAVTLTLALPLAACEDSTGVDTNLAETTVVLSQESGVAASLAPSFSAEAVASAVGGSVSLSDVQSINVRITQVQAIRRGSNDKKDEDVQTFNVTGGGTINLLALPAAAANGIQIAHGNIPTGTYSNLRLVFAENAMITFKRDVTVGGGPDAMTYKAGTAYPLRIGGEDRNGIKIPMASFEIGQGPNTISLTFDASASVKKVIATPNGIHMPPVMMGKHEKGDKNKKDKKN